MNPEWMDHDGLCCQSYGSAIWRILNFFSKMTFFYFRPHTICQILHVFLNGLLLTQTVLFTGEATRSDSFALFNFWVAHAIFSLKHTDRIWVRGRPNHGRRLKFAQKRRNMPDNYFQPKANNRRALKLGRIASPVNKAVV